MSDEMKQLANENAEVVRKRVSPDAQTESEEGSRTPTKTERDPKAELIAKAIEESAEENSTVRKQIVPDA